MKEAEHFSHASESSNIDDLTGLPNRYSFEKIMDRLLDQGATGYTLLIDMNDFKVVNQCFGYRAGDALIADFAHFLQSILSPAYQIFRMNGDIFSLICMTMPLEQLAADMETVLNRCRSPWSVGSRTTFCTVSIGAVSWPVDGKNTEEICRKLQDALAQARSSRNGFAIYREDGEHVTELAMQRREMEDMLRESVNKDFVGFSLRYQPIVCPAGGILGAEALLRFTAKTGKTFPPLSFIPLAEQSGLILPIGNWILREAIRFCKTMLDAGYTSFLTHINLSICQLEADDFGKTILGLLQKTGVPCGNIVLEVTESMAASHIGCIHDTCRQLLDAGLHVSLDDFGTGYSSLEWIGRMPIDSIKIDRSFINNMLSDEYVQSFVQLIAELKNKLGIMVYAEGIETPEQLLMCRKFGVDRIQGFLFHKAMPEQELLRMMQTNDTG